MENDPLRPPLPPYYGIFHNFFLFFEPFLRAASVDKIVEVRFSDEIG